MSTTIDSKVVEMRFDNKHFETHTRETMSTLDKLKQKLNLTGASKGLENINTSANKVNMSGMSKAIDSVQSKFSALEIMGVTALVNITNSAVEAGKRMVKALTIDPVMDGFSEYEMTLNAVQTTMAGTGKTAKEVEDQLKLLDIYADKTVYSTADMLNNLPKFTNAGVELEKATTAMIGIANATALAGGDAGKASIAFYNLGQAIGTGYLTRMDYNSINNAGIATMEWKNQMVEAAIAQGTLTKVGEDAYKAGNKTLTLQQLFIDGLQEQWATTDVMMKVFGDYGDETTEIGKKSYAAAQDIKTFSMMMDSLKATAGTGWKDTWQIIFGDLDEAKKFWTGLTNFISNIVTGMADFRNSVLEGALGKSFRGLFDNIKKTGDVVKNAVKPLQDYATLVDDIIGGKWGNGQVRWDALTKAGYDWAHAQNLVNEKLGNSLRRATNYKEVQDEVANTQEQVTETTTELIEELFRLSDAELKAKGYTDEQIKAFRELEKVAEKTGIPLKDFIKNLDEIDGRWLLINSFKNAGQGLVTVFNAIRDAWRETFFGEDATNETVIAKLSEGLFNAIAALHKFSPHLIVGDETADKLKRTLKGLFAILDLIMTITTGPIKIGAKILGQLLKALDLIPHDILGFTASIGDNIVAFRDWLDSVLDFTAVFEAIAPYLKAGAAAVKDWFKGLGQSEVVKKFTEYLIKSKDAIADWFRGLKEADNIAEYIFQGLINGLGNGAKGVIEFVINLGKQIIASIKKVLGIHSPSTEFFDIGKYMMMGLFNGISGFVKMVYNLIMSIGGKLINIVKELDIGSIFTILLGGGLAFSFIKIAQAIDRLTNPFEGLGDVLNEAADTLKVFQGTLKSFSLKLKAEAIKTIATAIAILAGSVALLAVLDQGKVWSAVGAITVLVGLLAGLTLVANNFGKADALESLSFGKIALALIGLGAAMLLLANVVKIIGGMSWEALGKAGVGLTVLVGFIVGLIAATNLITEKDITKIGSILFSISGAMLLLALTGKLIAGMTWGDMGKAGAGLVALGGLVVGLIAATKLVTERDITKIGSIILSVAGAMLLLSLTAKIIAGMSWNEMGKAAVGIVALAGLIVGLVAATKLVTDKSLVKVGSVILSVAGAMFLLSLTAKIIDGMTWGEMAKAGVGIAALSGIIVGLVAATKLVSEKDLAKVGGTILALSVAIGILAVSSALLSLISWEGLAKGITAVGFLSVFMAGLMAVSYLVPPGIKGTLITITVAISILAVSLAALSMIDPTKLNGATTALGTLLGMFALVIAVTSLAQQAIGPLIVLTVAIAVLAGAIYLIAQLPIEQSLGACASLSLLLLSLSASLAILALVGSLGPAAFIGIAALATLIVGLTAVVVAIGALMEKFPAIQSFLDTGLQTLIQLASGIGQAIGAFVSGALTQISAGLPVIGTNLSMFMTNLTPFINGAKTIDGSVLKGIGVLAGAIIALTAVDLIHGISAFLTGGTSFGQLGTELSMFMLNAIPFIMLSKQIDPTIMTGIKSLAEAVLILTGANVLEGLTSWLTGDNSLANFGSQLGELGTSLNQFVTNLGTFSDAQVATVVCAGNAIKALAQAASTIPNEGGLWGAICGENSLAKFGGDLPVLANNLNQFVTNLGTFSDAQVTTIDCAGKAIKSLAESAKEIPNEGGLWGAICGENSLATFGSNLPKLGTDLSTFVKNLGTFTPDQVTTVQCAGDAINALAQAAKEIPNEGGLWAKIAGDNSLATFAGQLPNLAKKLNEFVKELGVFNTTQIATVNSACNAIRSIAQLGEINIKDTGSGLNSFGGNMVKFAKKVKEFVTHIGEVGSDGIESAIAKTKELVSMAQTVASTNIDSLKTFGDSLKKVAKDGVNGFVKEFDGESPKSKAKKAVEAMVDSGIKGAENKKNKVKETFKSLAKEATDALNDNKFKEKAKQSGLDLCQGLINGLNNVNKRNAVYAAAYSLGQLAVQGEKDGQQSNSPSKATEKAGKWLGEGLVIGINQMGSRVYNAGKSMGEEATNSISSALNTALNLINSDMDANPTIRPVLDLSDVESGVGYLSGMFNNGPSLAVATNLGAISSGMNARIQNGQNSDVVSAINKLSKNLGNVKGDTYNVNGVTYDDGSNITDAVKTLVRAAKIERRT